MSPKPTISQHNRDKDLLLAPTRPVLDFKFNIKFYRRVVLYNVRIELFVVACHVLCVEEK